MSSQFETSFWDMCMRLEEIKLAEGPDGEYKKREQEQRIQRDKENQLIIDDFNSTADLKALDVKEKQRLHQKERRDNMSPEELNDYNEKIRAKNQTLRDNMSTEELKEFKEKNRVYQLERRDNMSPDERKEYNEKIRAKNQTLRDNMSTEELKEFKEKNRVYQLERRENMSPEEQNDFKEKNRVNQLERRENMSPDERKEYNKINRAYQQKHLEKKRKHKQLCSLLSNSLLPQQCPYTFSSTPIIIGNIHDESNNTDEVATDVAVALQDVEIKGRNNVISGSHKDAMDYVGNRRFRELITLSTSEYIDAPSRAHKSAVIENIFETIQNAGGRFLNCQKLTDTGIWKEFDKKQTYEKIGQALRARARVRASNSSPITLCDTVYDRALSSTPGPQVTCTHLPPPPPPPHYSGPPPLGHPPPGYYMPPPPHHYHPYYAPPPHYGGPPPPGHPPHGYYMPPPPHHYHPYYAPPPNYGGPPPPGHPPHGYCMPPPPHHYHPYYAPPPHYGGPPLHHHLTDTMRSHTTLGESNVEHDK
jgi:hypothetical protein